MIILAANNKRWRCLNVPAPQQEKTHRMVGIVIPNDECQLHTSIEEIIKQLFPAGTALPEVFKRWLEGSITT